MKTDAIGTVPDYHTAQGILVENQGKVYKNYCNVCGKLGGRVWTNPADASEACETHRRWSRRCRPGTTPVTDWVGLRWPQ